MPGWRLAKGQLAAFGKKRLDEGGAVGGENSSDDLDPMVHAQVRQNLETGADRAALGVIAAVNQARHTGLEDGSCAHAARLNRDVECGGGQAVVTKGAGGFAQDHDFGVGGGVAVANGAIAGARNNSRIVDQDRANGNFSCKGRGAGLVEGLLHEFEVGLHTSREDSMRGGGERILTQSSLKRAHARGALTIREWRNKLLRMVDLLGLLPQVVFPNVFASLRCVR